jgi:hypothetical protein
MFDLATFLAVQQCKTKKLFDRRVSLLYNTTVARERVTITNHNLEIKMTTSTTTLLTAQQLGAGNKLPYTPRHINEYLKDRVFLEGVHYIRLPGSRRVLYIWEAIQQDYLHGKTSIPMANGGICHG